MLKMPDPEIFARAHEELRAAGKRRSFKSVQDAIPVVRALASTFDELPKTVKLAITTALGAGDASTTKHALVELARTLSRVHWGPDKWKIATPLCKNLAEQLQPLSAD